MENSIILKRNTYESARVSVKKGKFLSKENFNKLSKLSFDEILKYLEENGFKEEIDNSYIQYEGFYLIEKILNTHTSKAYSQIFHFASKENKVLLETYYLKYQIHNLMVLVRSMKSNEKEIESYLIGDDRRKEKYIKAFQMPKIEDSIIYISKKLNLNSKKVLEKYENSIYDMENYLYKIYYEKLNSYNFIYNKKDEKNFFSYVKTYIDLINSRTFLKLKIENLQNQFENYYIEGGKLQVIFFKKYENDSLKNIMANLDSIFSNLEKTDESHCISSLDKKINEHKLIASKKLKFVSFGSPFFILKYLFEMETQISKLRILLKAKWLNLSSEQIEDLIK